MITADKLRSVLDYDPETGSFTWLVSPTNSVPRGAPAGCRDAYIKIRVCGRLYNAHRLAWLYVHGEWPPTGFQIDHINGDPMDNRISNLRVATSSQNQANKPRRTGTTSGVKGVYRERGTWRAGIRVNGKMIWLGTFAVKDDAARAYQHAAAFHFGEFVRAEALP